MPLHWQVWTYQSCSEGTGDDAPPVLAGIAASDAACCKALGRRSRSQDHHDAQELIAQIEPGGDEAAKRLRRLLDLKDTAHYGLIHVRGQDLRAALRHAGALIGFADEILRR